MRECLARGRTAASTSANAALRDFASFSPFEGSMVSKYSPAAGCCHAPPMKRLKRRSWRSSQSYGFFGILRRGAVLHADELFGNAHCSSLVQYDDSSHTYAIG